MSGTKRALENRKPLKKKRRIISLCCDRRGARVKRMLGLLPLAVSALWAQDAASQVGIFENHADVGTVLHAGSADYDAARRVYQMSGSGDNMWAAADAFQFAWKKASGDVDLTADIHLLSAGGNPHHKAVLMIRQSLDADSAYADAALHASGLASIQCRAEKGGSTYEIESSVAAPKRLRLTKRGDFFYLWVAGEDGKLQFAGGSARVHLREPFYVGLGVCAHDKDAVEKAEFANVDLAAKPQALAARMLRYGTIETVPYPSGDRRVSYAAEGVLEDPTWTADGASLEFLHDGHLERVPWTGGKAESVAGVEMSAGPLVQAPADDFNNWFARISPDGKRMLVLSSDKAVSSAPVDREVALRVMSMDNTPAKVLARILVGGLGSLGPQAWSPDGRRVAFVSYQWLPE